MDRVFGPVRQEFRGLVEAQVRQQVALVRQETALRLADQVVELSRQRVDAAENLLDRTLEQAARKERQAARQLVDSSRAQLADAIADKLEDELPTDVAGDRWWVDPIVGVRAQLNLTCWLTSAPSATSAALERVRTSRGISMAPSA